MQHCCACLKVNVGDRVLSTQECWRAFVDNNSRHFVASFVAYTHYRRAGWCPKSGLKFGANWVLYRFGPDYFHASYQVTSVSTPSSRR